MTVLSGAREGTWTRLRHLTARAAAHDLATFVVPGLEIARAHGLDLTAAGLRPVATPRHAAVLLVVGELPEGLRLAAAVVWAQMPRPRAVLALGAGGIDPLPGPDLAVPLRQEALATGVAELRRRFAVGAFSSAVTDFDVAAVRTDTTYTCPMHPEIVRAEPGRCPLCGMDLVPLEQAGGGMGHDGAGDGEPGPAQQGEHGGDARGYTCPMHPEIARDAPGRCPICGMDLVPRGEAGDDAQETGHQDERQGEQGGGDRGYTCPMHPEVVQDGPGSCPICGMDLVPRETDIGEAVADKTAKGEAGVYTCPMHPEIVRAEPGRCPLCGMDLVPREAGDHGHAAHIDDQGNAEAPKRHGGHDGPGGQDTMPPDEHGGHGDHEAHATAGERRMSTEMSGMDGMAHGGHDMSGMGGGGHDMSGMGGGFMSMVMMTRDLPRSADGLPMEWLDVPCGPLFPGLPGGLTLTLTLDGDTVAGARVTTAAARGLEEIWPGSVAGFPDRLARLDPLAPVAYRLLAERALAAAADVAPDGTPSRAHVGAAERERAASHLNWLAAFARLLGLPWLADEAARRHLALQQAGDVGAITREAVAIAAMGRRIHRTPLLARRLRRIGVLGMTAGPPWPGPVARAAGDAMDARSDDPRYRDLGFAPLTGGGADAWARLTLRLAEITQSLDLVAAAGALDPPPALPRATAVGTGVATVETPRGTATLRVTIRGDVATAIHLTTPSTAHLAFVKPVAEGQEMTDALVGIASLDLSPWELGR